MKGKIALIKQKRISKNIAKNTLKFSNAVSLIAIQPDDKVITLSSSVSYSSIVSNNFIHRFNADGTQDKPFTANTSIGQNKFPPTPTFWALAIQPLDSRILVAGNFFYGGSASRSYLIRFNSDGTEDTAFTANAVVNGATARFNVYPNALAVQSDGKILVGGPFTSYNAQTGKSYFLRLNSDGTEDTVFTAIATINGVTAKFNNTVYTIAVQPLDGKILVGGIFTDYNTQAGKSYLIRFNSDGTEDTTFSTNAVVNGVSARFNTSVTTLAVQSDGKILVGGAFTNYNAQPGKSYVIRLNSDGTEDTAFTANAVVNGVTAKFSGTVNTITAQSDGKVLVGGNFTSYNAQSGISYLIRFNSDGTEDTTFSTNAVVNGGLARFNGSIGTIAVRSDGKILVGGSFINYSTQIGKNRSIRLNSDGTEDTAFNLTYSQNGFISTTVKSITNNNKGHIIIGGDFVNVGSTGRSYFRLMTQSGIEDTAFTTNAVVNGVTAKFITGVFTVAAQSDNKILVGGGFNLYNAQVGRNKLIRLNSDGTEDTAFTTAAVVNGTTARLSNTVNIIAVQPDGKILIGGIFINYLGTGKSYLSRLNANGTEDTAFTTAAVVNGVTARFNGAIATIAVQTDGKVLVGGSFTTYSAQTGKNYLIRFNSDGTEDTAFSTNAVLLGASSAKLTAAVSTIAVQPDGKILIGGAFTGYASSSGKNYLIRLNSDGTEDTTFSTNAVVNGVTPKFTTVVNTIAVQSDGKILVGGAFLNYNAQLGKSYLIKLNSDGTEDTDFSTNAVTSKWTGIINYLKIDSTNNAFIGGAFTASPANYPYICVLDSKGNPI